MRRTGCFSDLTGRDPAHANRRDARPRATETADLAPAQLTGGLPSLTQSQAPGRMQKAGECQQQNNVKAITCSKDLRHPIQGVGRLPHRGKAVSLMIARPGHGGLCLLHPVVWAKPGKTDGSQPRCHFQ